MTTRTNAQIIQLRSAYAQLYCSDLERDMIGETSGYFKRMLVALCTGARDESMITDPLRANQVSQVGIFAILLTWFRMPINFIVLVKLALERTSLHLLPFFPHRITINYAWYLNKFV